MPITLRVVTYTPIFDRVHPEQLIPGATPPLVGENLLTADQISNSCFHFLGPLFNRTWQGCNNRGLQVVAAASVW